MNNSWALITGASRGLGAFLAQSFWGAGWNIALVARDEIGLEKILAELPSRLGQRALIFPCDLSFTGAVSNLPTQIVRKLPRLDVLINNAAIHGPIGPLVGNNLALWNETIQVNLTSPVTLCHGLIDFIANSGGGSIINLSGGGATGPRSNFTAYASAKAALVRFSETLAQEVQAQNIRVNCIAPGAMNTALLHEVVSSGIGVVGRHEFEIAEGIIKQGGASMDKVAKLALFLAGDASLGITGKLVSAMWDNWQEWPKHLDQLSTSDVYTLRRISGRDRGIVWGDV